jgi:hypothetical protein
VEISAEAPSLIQRNKLEELQVQETLFKNGLLSGRTWAQMQGLDWDLEQENIRREKAAGHHRPYDRTKDQPQIPTDEVGASYRRDLGLDRDPYSTAN